MCASRPPKCATGDSSSQPQDGILILDFDTSHADVNPFMSKLLGYSREHFLGKELWEIGLFTDIETSRAAFKELKDKKYIRYEHLPLATEDGQQVEVEFVSNVYDEGGTNVVQSNIRDITKRRALERLAQEQTDALADLHRRKDEFLAMFSHELRNPLASMSSAVHLLRLQKDESRIQRQARTTIERQMGSLARMIDDLLDVSRITTGRIHLRCKSLAIHTVIERAVETVRPLLNQRGHELKVLIPAEPIWLNADPTRLEQVVVNLLTNAAKFTDEGGGLWLNVRQDGQECMMIVGDTGVGISPRTTPHVFDLFTQSERSLGRSQSSLGIGLAIVQKLVEMHGGAGGRLQRSGAR